MEGLQRPGTLFDVFRLIGLYYMIVLVCDLDSSNVDLETGKSEAYGLPIHVRAVTHCCLFCLLRLRNATGSARLGPVTRANIEFPCFQGFHDSVQQ